MLTKKECYGHAIFCFLLLLANIVQAKNYYISSCGNDNNPGSIDKPWASFAPAHATVQAGDSLIIRQGVYSLTEQLHWENSGTEEAWINISGFPGERVVIDASGIPELGRHVKGAFHLEGASYVRIANLTLEYSRGMGIAVFGPSTNVTIQQCRVRMTYGPCIGSWNAANVKVLHCEVSEANARIMSPDGWRQHEAPHEAISIAGVKGFEVAYNHVHHCEKEGIDVKEVSAHGRVHHNLVHDVPRQGLYVDAWFGLLEDVEIDHNVVFNCEWGFVASVEGKSSELKKLRVHHNLIYNNTGSGIYMGRWGGDGPRSDLKIYNNTLVDNGQVHHWSGATGNIDLRSHNIKDMEVYGNLCVRGGAYNLASFINPAEDTDKFGEYNINIHDNFLDEWIDKSKNGAKGYGWVYPVKGRDQIIGKVEFVDEAIGDYRPSISSQVINKEMDGGAYGAYDGNTAFERLKWPIAVRLEIK